MTDKAVAITATDIFGLGGNFHPQSSTITAAQDWPNILDAAGNNQCEKEVNNRTDVSCNYGYCNAVPDIVSDLGTVLAAFGDVENGYKVDQIVINFEKGA